MSFLINDKDLNKCILRVRYLNNRKLTNNLLKIYIILNIQIKNQNFQLVIEYHY